MGSSQEEVEVRVQQGAPGALGVPDETAPTPTMFLRGGQLYVIRRVLGQWPSRGERRRSAAVERAETVWRVEASAGREVGAAIYDLVCRSAAADRPSWTLSCVTD